MTFALPYPFHFFRRRWAGASCVLALSLGLGACTENKAGPAPGTVTPPTTTAPNADARDYGQYTELIWSDEFDGNALDQTKWGYDTGGSGWGNNELEYYTNTTENAFVTGGNLTIQAKLQSQGGRSYTSARLLTKGKQSFNFGRVDVRAKLPQGKGIWPAIWMLGADIDQNNWPVCGEIDIMELRGQEPNKILSTMHFGNSTADHRMRGTEKTLTSGNFSDAFHLFSVVRSKDQMRFFLDGQLYYTFSSGDATPYPFNNPFFMVLNVAVGGDFLGSPDGTTTFPQQMQVDYVRYYQYK
jgi:beta-glucanase (GH16 family)